MKSLSWDKLLLKKTKLRMLNYLTARLYVYDVGKIEFEINNLRTFGAKKCNAFL